MKRCLKLNRLPLWVGFATVTVSVCLLCQAAEVSPRRVYSHLLEPREHPDYERRAVKPPGWNTFGGRTQFTCLRGFNVQEDRIVGYAEELERFTRTHDLGRVIWPSYPILFAKNLGELADEIKRRELFLFDVWGYVPGSGPANAADPVERESSAVQAVAVFYPPTDLLNLGASTENPGDGGPPKSFVRAFGPDSTNLAVWKVIGREVSPIYHVSSNLPPVLIIHGGADTLVPLDQSERFVQRARQLGRPIELIVRPGKGHGWPTMILDLRLFADWFDRWLPPPAK